VLKWSTIAALPVASGLPFAWHPKCAGRKRNRAIKHTKPVPMIPQIGVPCVDVRSFLLFTMVFANESKPQHRFTRFREQLGTSMGTLQT
jgi:hypothetical protein